MSTGFQKNAQGLYIEKDPLAQLTYTFDWSRWLAQGDQLANVEYSVAARANDPEPLVKVSQGIQDAQTYVELSGGQLGKVYTVTADITTQDGLRDRRNFRVQIANRSA